MEGEETVLGHLGDLFGCGGGLIAGFSRSVSPCLRVDPFRIAVRTWTLAIALLCLTTTASAELRSISVAAGGVL